jgi:hypothetical protein
MELAPGDIDACILERIGYEALEMLRQRDFGRMAERFGYTLAYGRELADALQNDSQPSADSVLRHQLPKEPTVVVKYFDPNDVGLLAVVECIAPQVEGGAVLIDLVVTSSGSRKWVTIEDVRHAV